MTPIDYKALAERIQQAIDAPPLTVPEVAIIDKADLRTVVTMLEGMADVKPVGILTVARFRGHLENYSFDYTGELPEGSHPLYSRMTI